MTVAELTDLAINGELKQLSVKEDCDAIRGYINLGLLELYKRFPLSEEEAIITQRVGKMLYKLDGTDPDVKIDTSKDFIMVTGCYDGGGNWLSINDEDDIYGINTPFYNVVEVPYIVKNHYLSVIYRAAPDFLTSDDQKIPIPPQLIEALLHYIGYRGHGSVTAQLEKENNSHYLRFDQSCNRVISQGLITSDDLVTKKFRERGFI